MSAARHPDAVRISEVGPRDGLQSIKATMPTAHKCAWVTALAQSGVAEIEVTSFVPPKLLPQLADSAEVVRHALTLTAQRPDLTIMALVPNLKGAQDAVAAGVHKITIPVSASEAHSLANVRKTRVQMVQEVAKIVDFVQQTAPHVAVEVGLSTAFGCTIQGVVTQNDVLWLIEQLVGVGIADIALSDTTGYANPQQVKQLFTESRRQFGAVIGAAHLHNTRGLGLANAWAAYEAGVRTFDASMGGIGGCPYAPGASGNVCTEDLVFMFEAGGIDTGVDIEKLIAAREAFRQGLPGEPIYGMLPEAGLPKNFRL